MRDKTKVYLITGVAGFIGANLAKRILETKSDNIQIIGIDNLNDYYDVKLKEYRLFELKTFDKFEFIKCDISEKDEIEPIFEKYKPNIVVNLAAQAGVRYSITNPDAYIKSNIVGFYNILECCRKNEIEHLVYASSSSVYGLNKKIPYSTEDRTDMPVSLYAATKKSNELLAYSYSKLYNIRTTGLRFFTVYGPAGRLLNGEKIQIYNYGKCERDFTYIDDIVEGIVRTIHKIPIEKKGEDGLPIPPYKVYNIGKGKPDNLLDFVNILQEELINAEVLPKDYNFEIHKELVAMQPGDVPITYADTKQMEEEMNFKPSTSLREGLRKFAEWYKKYYMQ